MFITFEGGEGAGKSTQVARLGERLRALGHEVITTREPGGAPGAEQIRDLLVTGEPGRWSARAEALLNYAARDEHLRSTIIPALNSGAIVICDRFADSTDAYQGHAGGCDPALLAALNRAVVDRCQPDLTLILDLPARVGLARAQGRAGAFADRFERKGLAFHEALRAGFQAIARDQPDRCIIIDGESDADTVAERVWVAVAPRLPG